MKYVLNVDKNFNDTIIVSLDNLKICGIYIPPRDSPYFDDQFQILNSITENAKQFKEELLIIGDMNARIGEHRSLCGMTYSTNCDKTTNSHGSKLLEIIKNQRVLPLNNLKIVRASKR